MGADKPNAAPITPAQAKAVEAALIHYRFKGMAVEVKLHPGGGAEGEDVANAGARLLFGAVPEAGQFNVVGTNEGHRVSGLAAEGGQG